jgi:MYXO-CTERM domain-containing protein
MTYHTCSDSQGHGMSSAEWFHDDAWLDFNMIQTHHYPGTIVDTVAQDYGRAPAKPTVLGEGFYFGYQGCTGRVCRSQPYWALLAGSLGFTAGQRYVWWVERTDDGNDGSTYVSASSDENENWQDYLATPSMQWAVIWQELFRRLEWWKLVPDQSILIAGEGTGEEQKVAARSSEGDVVLVYFPTPTEATVDLSAITLHSQADVRWHDPTDGSEQGGGTVPTSGSSPFTPPAGWEDALLQIGDDVFPPSAGGGGGQGGAAAGGAGGTAAAGGAAVSPSGADQDEGCGCRTPGNRSPGPWAALGVVALLGLRRHRRIVS